MGKLVSSNGREDGADVDLKILLDSRGIKMIPTFCISWGNAMRQDRNDATAVKNAMQNYRRVVEHKDALDRIDAGERLATLLLRDKLNQPKEARAVINKLVE